MNDKALQATVGTVAMVGGFSFLLPTLDKSFEANPDGETYVATWLKRGEVVFIVIVLAVGILQSQIADSTGPLYAALVMGGLIVGIHEMAIRTPTGGTDDGGSS